MVFKEYKNVVLEAELGVDIAEVADEKMNNMAAQGWHLVSVCPHPRAGKILVTFAR